MIAIGSVVGVDGRNGYVFWVGADPFDPTRTRVGVRFQPGCFGWCYYDTRRLDYCLPPNALV